MGAIEERMGLALKLACLLASYEMDDPHVSLPGLDVGDESKQKYPEITPEKFKRWMESEHNGDCVNLPAPCIRCYADMIAHKAKWIAGKLKN